MHARPRIDSVIGVPWLHLVDYDFGLLDNCLE
jgi:hypothetical protein